MFKQLFVRRVKIHLWQRIARVNHNLKKVSEVSANLADVSKGKPASVYGTEGGGAVPNCKATNPQMTN